MILITGATGLLGSHLLYTLVSSGERVRATKRSSSNLEEVKKIFSFYSDYVEDLFSKVEWADADLLYPESLDPVFENITQVYHAAAAVSFDPRDRKKLIHGNRKVTANIVNACLEKSDTRLLHVSSTSALGSSPNGDPISEKTIWTPDKKNSGYSISKFLSEMEVWRGIEEGLNAVIVNPSIILGPGFWHKGSSSMFTNVRRGLRYYTHGVTGYVGVEDTVKCIIELMKSNISNERFIINSENLSYKEVFTMMAEAFGVKPPHIEATPFLAGIAWRGDAVRSWFGSERVITKETVRAGLNKTHLSNEKVKEVLGYDFEGIDVVIRKIASRFVSESLR